MNDENLLNWLLSNNIVIQIIKQFPLKDGYDAINESNISEYKDLVDVSNDFKCEFYNAGIKYILLSQNQIII